MFVLLEKDGEVLCRRPQHPNKLKDYRILEVINVPENLTSKERATVKSLYIQGCKEKLQPQVKSKPVIEIMAPPKPSSPSPPYPLPISEEKSPDIPPTTRQPSPPPAPQVKPQKTPVFVETNPFSFTF